LLPLLDELGKLNFLSYVPLSAARRENIDALIETLRRCLPEGEPLFPPDFKTDKDLKFRAAEVIREKLFEHLHQEVPYGLTVEIESMERADDGARLEVGGLIWVERESHKPIVIGKGGRLLKSVGHEARLELSELLGERVHLNLWIKVREHWSDNERELRRLGYDAP
jgi:GTP-binding protein Era